MGSYIFLEVPFTVFLSVCLAAALFIPKTAFSAGTEGRRLGDVNNDGIVSIRDVTAVQRLTAELETYDSLSEKAADVDVSGDVTISDATCIQHYLADYPTDYPINEPLDPYAPQAQAALNALKTRLAQTKAAADGLPVLIRSYDTEKPQLSMAAYTYDNALAAMAFISSGDKDDALPRFFGQADGIIFKQAVRLELCGVAFILLNSQSTREEHLPQVKGERLSVFF